MKSILTLLLLLFSLTSVCQSDSEYKADLEALHNILKKTPSYKDQIKGKAAVEYNDLFQQLKNNPVSNPSSYQYFYRLAQLFFPIRDNHLTIYQVAKVAPDSLYPSFDGNVDSLQSVLSQKPLDSLEGIFYFGDHYTVGLYKSKPREYIGVVIDPKETTWKKGQEVIHLYETNPGYFKAIYGYPKAKIFFLFPIEKYVNHSLVNSRFSKQLDEKDFTNLPENTPDFTFKEIAPGIQYLRIKQFSASPEKMKRSKEFYDSIKHLLTAPDLILDLRNNNGGADKVSKKFLKLIKKYVKHGNVFVLVNNATLSQGEIFTLQLKKLKNVKVFGETTHGMLVYGSNYGKRMKLPSQVYEVYITDMKGDKQYIPYENYGVKTRRTIIRR